MDHLLYLMFRCDGDVMESWDFGGFFEGSKHTPCSEDLHRSRVMPAAADVPLIPRLLREHTCLTSLGITTGNKR